MISRQQSQQRVGRLGLGSRMSAITANATGHAMVATRGAAFRSSENLQSCCGARFLRVPAVLSIGIGGDSGDSGDDPRG
jgi:hypothetical protein